jgi:hypothetical protein
MPLVLTAASLNNQTGDSLFQNSLWTIFFPTKHYVSDHLKSIFEEQKPFGFWGLRPQTPTKHFVHGLAIIFNACAGVVYRSNYKLSL